jgi:hypothetical protein
MQHLWLYKYNLAILILKEKLYLNLGEQFFYWYILYIDLIHLFPLKPHLSNFFPFPCLETVTITVSRLDALADRISTVRPLLQSKPLLTNIKVFQRGYVFSLPFSVLNPDDNGQGKNPCYL